MFVGNDVQVATEAEFQLGAGKPYKSILGVFWGTGVGGGLILAGKPWVGRGGAGEIGHVVVKIDGARCTCGRKGCLEAYAGRGVDGGARAPAGREGSQDRPVQADEGAQPHATDERIWAHALERDDKVAKEIIDEAVDALGAGVASAVNLLDVEAVIIGGGLGVRFGQPFAERIAEAMQPHLFNDQHPPDVRVAALGDLGGALGAALLARQATTLSWARLGGALMTVQSWPGCHGLWQDDDAGHWRQRGRNETNAHQTARTPRRRGMNATGGDRSLSAQSMIARVAALGRWSPRSCSSCSCCSGRLDVHAEGQLPGCRWSRHRRRRADRTGAKVGSVQSIGLTPDGQAQVAMGLNSSVGALPEGTVARIYENSLSGIANKYVVLEPGTAPAPIPDGGVITVGPHLRAGQPRPAVRHARPADAGGTAPASSAARRRASTAARRRRNKTLKYLAPALLEHKQRHAQLAKSEPTFDSLLVQGAQTMQALGSRTQQLTQLVSNTNATTAAIASQSQSLEQALTLLAPTLNHSTSTFAGLRSTLDVL